MTSHAPSSRRLLLILLLVLAAHAAALATLFPWLRNLPDAAPHAVQLELTATNKAVAQQPAKTDTSPSPISETAKAIAPARPVEPRRTTRTAASETPARPNKPAPASPVPAASPPPKPAPASTAMAKVPTQTTDSARQQAVDTDWRRAYLQRLRQTLAHHKQYPPMARRFGEEGEALLSFDIQRDGRITQESLIRGTGSERLDQAALQAARQLARFEPLPDHYPQDSLTISVPLIYRLD